MDFEFDASELMKLYRKALAEAYCMILDDSELQSILNELNIGTAQD